MTSVAVLGPGGVGGFIAAALSRADEEVVVIAREGTPALMEVESVRLGEFFATATVCETLEEPVDTLLVATKATTLESALDRVQATPSLVVPLLNGLDHMGVLRKRFGDDRVAAGTIRIESDRPQPGKIVQTSPFLRVDLASDDAALRPRLDALAEMLERAEIPATVGDNEAQILWSKLVRLNALACTTSAADKPIGFIRSDPQWRESLIACIDEAAAVADADGAHVDPRDPVAELDEAHPELGSSMQRDISAGREPELDAIPGAVLRAAARHGLRCPTIDCLTRDIAAKRSRVG